MDYQYSHTDIRESAQQYMDRIKESVPITKEEFLAMIGDDAITALQDSYGTPQGFHKTEKVVYASIQNIDYIFKPIKEIIKWPNLYLI